MEEPQAAGTVYFATDVDDGVLVAGEWPLILAEPQERVQRRAVEQIVEFVPVIQFFDFSCASDWEKPSTSLLCRNR